MLKTRNIGLTLTCAKFNADVVNISEVASRKTKWPHFGPPSI